MNFEIPFPNIAKLVASLRSTGLDIDLEDHPGLVGDTSASVTVGEPLESDAVGTLQITFIHSEPDLVIPVPPIPE
ncbi:MAG: hypothetical protein P0111_11915 [Nitrospira sp.]|nr:hypothetical protein [Nitrospira sp.]